MIICRQIIWFLLLTHQAVGQDTIRLINHSFEMTGAPEATLAGWKTLGVEPNIQPGENGCTLPARDGKNYIGLTVVGEISTGIAQELKVVLQKDSTYVLSLFLAHSKRYEGAQLTKTGFKAVTMRNRLFWDSSD
jgi:hypothetical protein